MVQQDVGVVQYDIAMGSLAAIVCVANEATVPYRRTWAVQAFRVQAVLGHRLTVILFNICTFSCFSQLHLTSLISQQRVCGQGSRYQEVSGPVLIHFLHHTLHDIQLRLSCAKALLRGPGSQNFGPRLLRSTDFRH